jgi:SAM-dependent methyltransferase
MDAIATYNRHRWCTLAVAKAVFTRPWLDLDEATARQRLDPRGWLGHVTGKHVLCLGGGGGQQSAAFGLLGARVTVVDLSKAQLRRDRETAVHYGQQVTTVCADMRDLSLIQTDAFDIVYQPYSLNFVPDPRVVFREVGRVLRPSGRYQLMCANPAFLGLSQTHWRDDGYPLRLFYEPGAEIRGRDEAWVFGNEPPALQIPQPVEYRHTLEDLTGGLADAGFVILCVAEEHFGTPDRGAQPGTMAHLTAIAPPWLWMSARREA